MSIRLRMNLVLLAVLFVGICLAAALTYTVELRRAKEDTQRNAELLISLATAIRTYTVSEVRPLLQAFDHGKFLPQTVPSFAAQETFSFFEEEYPEFSYREAAVNPTNRSDLANGLEVDVINQFRRDPDLERLTGEFTDGGSQFSYIATPLRITNEACLSCHSTPENAPAQMVAQYGRENGFGWQMNETVATQIVTVPARLAYEKALHSTLTLLVSMLSVFICIAILLNIFLGRAFFAPLQKVSDAASQLSRGDLRLPPLPGVRRDEIGALERSMMTMWRSFNALIGHGPAAGSDEGPR